VLSIDQPPQLNPTIMVTTAPAAAPWKRRLIVWSCNIEGSDMSLPSVKTQSVADTRMDAELTSWLKGRRLAWACRESTMRVGLENVDGNQQA
jgi:hypothetical protein